MAHGFSLSINRALAVTVIDTTTNLVIASIPIGGNEAKDILFTRNGRCAYIANYSEGTVNVIDTVHLPGKDDPHWSRLPSPCPVSRGRPRVRYQLPGQFRVRH